MAAKNDHLKLTKHNGQNICKKANTRLKVQICIARWDTCFSLYTYEYVQIF